LRQKQYFNRNQRIELWAKSIKHFGNFDSAASYPRYIRENPRSVYARVPHMIAQLVLKIEIS